MTRFPRHFNDEYTTVGTPLEVARGFAFWLSCPDMYKDDEVFENTEFYKVWDNLRPNGSTEPPRLCLMDYVGVWLLNSNGALYAESWADWLLGVIAIIDDWHRGSFPQIEAGAQGVGSELHSPTEMSILYWGDLNAEPPKTNEYGFKGAHHDEEGFAHLALRRAVFERRRSELLG